MTETVSNLAPGIILRPALCLDLDGTVRRSKSGSTFIKNFNDIELIPGIEKVIWFYRNKEFLIFGVSNQAGVAHGYKLPMEVENELSATFNLFQRNPFHAVKQCYFDAAGHIAPYNTRSLFRKPAYGMLAQLEAESYISGYAVNWDESIFVGDRPEDRKCADAAGINFMSAEDFLEEHQFVPESEIPPMEPRKFIHTYGRCCITGQPLKTSRTLQIVPLNYHAEWKQPRAAVGTIRVIGEDMPCAVAFVHESCVVNGKLEGEIKYAVELREETTFEIVYHELSTLNKINPEHPDQLTNPRLN